MCTEKKIEREDAPHKLRGELDTGYPTEGGEMKNKKGERYPHARGVLVTSTPLRRRTWGHCDRKGQGKGWAQMPNT